MGGWLCQAAESLSPSGWMDADAEILTWWGTLNFCRTLRPGAACDVARAMLKVEMKIESVSLNV